MEVRSVVENAEESHENHRQGGRITVYERRDAGPCHQTPPTLGIKSAREFAEKTGVDRNAIAKAESGTSSSGTLDRLEAWLNRFEEETGNDMSDESSFIEFRLSGVFGIDSIVVKGPVG